ncbi:MAG: hypothetical protein HOO93_16085 [Methyloglobulus sp.]|nr:hypothetical protein [Methyloglobulus sp.]
MKPPKYLMILYILMATLSFEANAAGKSWLNFCKTGCIVGHTKGTKYPTGCIPIGVCSSTGFSASQPASASTLFTNTAQVKNTRGIDFDLKILSKISESNPYVGQLLWNFHIDHWQPMFNLLHGLTVTQRIFTTEDAIYALELMENNLADNKEFDSIGKPTQKEFGIQTRWVGQEMPKNKLLVTFTTEWVESTNDNLERRPGFIAPVIEVEFSTVAPYKLLSWRPVKR